MHRGTWLAARTEVDQVPCAPKLEVEAVSVATAICEFVEAGAERHTRQPSHGGREDEEHAVDGQIREKLSVPH